MKIITSAASHYSVEKGAILEGYGLENIVKVKCTENGEMLADDLEEKIKEILAKGEVPLMVNATVGTTVSGAIDPIEEIGHICKKYKVWLHVDAALGGAFWMSDKLKTRIGNCTDVDSVSWDPHKALVVPLQATFFLCKHPGLMEKSNSTKADYLFHKERNSYHVSLDTGDRSLQCGRVIDILKCWTYFKGNGWKEIGRHIEREHESGPVHLTNCIAEAPKEWVLVYPGTTINVIAYYYIPLRTMRGVGA
jgi:glutamate/tyrosine decarboxylase-like PLP-dependent enzyme